MLFHLRDGWSRNFILLLILILALLVSGSCGGSNVAESSTQEQLQSQSGRSWETFPQIKDLAATGNPAFEDGYFRIGGEYDQELPNTLPVDYDLSFLRVDTLDALKDETAELGYAMYRFKADEVHGEPILHLEGYAYLNDEVAESGAYIGLANYTKGTWQWYPWPEENQLTLPGLSDYTSEAGNLTVVLLCQSARLTIRWVRLGDRHWQFEELDTPEADSRILIARLGSDGYIRLFGWLSDARQAVITQTETGWDVEPVYQYNNANPPSNGFWWYGVDFQLDNNDVPYLCGVEAMDWGLSWISIAYRTSLGYKKIGGPYEYTDNSPGGPTYTGVRSYTSMAFDDANRLHLAYFTGDDATLWYGILQEDGTWVTELVDDNGKTGEACALVLNSNGYPHITYNANQHSEQRYAYYDGSSWNYKVLSGVNNTYGAGMTVIDNDTTLLSYVHEGRLWVGTKFDGGHSVSTFDFGASLSSHGCQALLKPDGTPTVYANGPTDGIFKLANFSNLEWHHHWLQLPDGHNYNVYPYQSGCVADREGNVHVFYVDEDSNKIVHAYLP